MVSKVSWIIPVVATAAIGVAVALGGWNLKETADLPKIYETKSEVEKKFQVHEKRHEELNNNLEKNFDRMFQMQMKLQDAINDLKK